MRGIPRVIAAMCFVASGDSLDPVAYPLMVIGALAYVLLIWASIRARTEQQGKPQARRRR